MNKDDKTFEEVIRERTATRKFKSTQVPKEKLNQILEAGRLAPTAKNLQPQKILVVSSTMGLEKIDKVTPCRFNAPTVLVVCSDKNIAWKNKDYSSYEIDASIVATHMMLESTNVGVDNIWVLMFDKDQLKKEFNLSDSLEPVCLIPLGFKALDYLGNPQHSIRKSINELVEYI